MPRISKVKKKAVKTKTKTVIKPKIKSANKIKETNKGPIKISKTYIPKDTEKYMCEKHKVFFRMKLQEWRKELVKSNNDALYNGSMDDNSISADIVDQANSYTDKNVEMKAINRQIKLISEIDKALFRIKLNEWKKELIKANNEALYNGSMDDNNISADLVDQASSYIDKNVEMKAINRQIKLISEIDKALRRIMDDTYGYCLDTAEPIGLKRLMARPVAKYTIAAQEKHEKDEKVHADD